MKARLTYTLSLFLIATSILLIVYYPDSGRVDLIAGGLSIAGFTFNIIGFSTKRMTKAADE